MATERVITPLTSTVTPTIHRTPYLAIDASRPELSQAGKTVLITGGTAGIGFDIAKGFIAASASTIIVTGRRQEVLDKAVTSLKDIAAASGKDVRIIGERGDVVNPGDTNALGIIINVLILNAARFAVPKPLLELSIDYVWEPFKVNVRGPIHFTEKFYKQSLVNISTQSIHESKNEYIPMAGARPEYGLTKASGTLTIQFIAQELQLGATRDMFDFDDVTLAGNYAVWAASPEARYLHGRFTWASWDVDELREKFAKRLETDPEFLRVGVCGLMGPDVAY
ncbi:hypothetical protein OQA88_8084 [Cercophora sp. LCS_1]